MKTTIASVFALLFFFFGNCFCISHAAELDKNKIYKKETLPNGLTIVAMESHKVPLVTLVLVFKAGAMTETPETNGLSHFWEHMFFKGNKTLPTQELFKKRVRQLGISYNGDTGAEVIKYYFTMPSRFLDEGLKFMRDAISEPLLDDKEIERERGVILDEYDRNASHPYFDFRLLNKALLFGKDFMYLKDPLGRRRVIEHANREQMLQIKNKIFVPQNAALFVSGDLTFEELKIKAMKHFGLWKSPSGWMMEEPQKFPPLKESKQFVMLKKDVSNATVSFQFRGPNARSQPKDSFVADILINLLGHQSGKFRKTYIESGLSFGADLDYLTQSHGAAISLYAVTSPEKIKTVAEKLKNEIKLWTKPGYFSDGQLDDIRRNLLINRKFELNKPSHYIKTLSFWWAVTGFEYYDGYLENLRKVTLADVKHFVENYLLEKPMVTSYIVSPEDAPKAGLEDTSRELMMTELADYYGEAVKKGAKNE